MFVNNYCCDVIFKSLLLIYLFVYKDYSLAVNILALAVQCQGLKDGHSFPEKGTEFCLCVQRPTQFRLQLAALSGILSSGIKRPEFESHHSPSSSAEDNKQLCKKELIEYAAISHLKAIFCLVFNLPYKMVS